MRFSNWGSLAFAGLIAVAALVQDVYAAVVVPVADNNDCKLLVYGAIEQGDFRKFVSAAQLSFVPLDEVRESTSANTVCLDSPGGNLYEGMLFANYFYENGVGTVVREGELCASACALMFMMGRAAGPEVSFINRKLHINGRLGFHRPSLRLPAEDRFGSRDIEAFYDMAVTSVVDYIVLANKTAPWSNRPMVHSDLVERIFATPGDEMFFIDTVEKAARWDIDLIGVDIPTRIDEERAYYACENALQWNVALHESPLDFVGLNLQGYWTTPYSYQVSSEGGQRFDVTSSKAGYASAGCMVEFKDQTLSICAVDEYTATRLGDGICPADASSGFEWFTPLALWRPDTKLTELNAGWTPQSKTGVCQIHSANGQLTDRERCSADIRIEYSANNVGINRIFTWPTGNRTQVISFGQNHQINTDAANTNYVEGQDTCYTNSRTGNRFCFKSD